MKSKTVVFSLCLGFFFCVPSLFAQSEMEMQRKEIDALKYQIAIFEKTVANLQAKQASDVTSLNAQIVTLTRDLNDTKTTLTSTRGNVTTLQVDLNQTRLNVTALQTKSNLAEINDNEIFTMLRQWHGALESWRGHHILLTPTFEVGRFDSH